MSFLRRMLLLLSLLWLAWLFMMLVHEAGHVLAAIATGGTVQRVVWHPLVISRTDVSPNPSPLAVAWAGPVVGSLLPLGIAVAAWPTRVRALASFFAGFCLIANGAYLAVGWIDRAGDAGEIVRLGSPRWLLIAVGTFATITGLWIWHRLSPRLRKPVPTIHAWWTFVAAVLASFLGLMVGWRG